MLEALLWDRRCYVTASLTVSLIIIFVATSDLVKKPYYLYIAVGVLILWTLFSLWRWAKIGNSKASEKIVYNLTIKIKCSKRNFEDAGLRSVEEDIEEYGLAIHRAKKFLWGNWKVTKSGRLIRGFAKDEKSHTATLDIDETYPGLILLEKVLAGKAQLKDTSCGVHLHFDESGGVVNIGADSTGLYLH